MPRTKKQRPIWLAQHGSHRAARAAKAARTAAKAMRTAERARQADLRRTIENANATTNVALAFKAAI